VAEIAAAINTLESMKTTRRPGRSTISDIRFSRFNCPFSSSVREHASNEA